MDPLRIEMYPRIIYMHYVEAYTKGGGKDLVT